MTVDTINSILFPPFLFILFFSTVSAFISSPSQPRTTKTGTPKNIQSAIAPSAKLYQSQSSPQTQSSPQSARNRERLRLDEVVV
ncbi:MAG: hypothetical protein SVX43_20565 [Cyanobacteriota bacterium]|nr:hypothetical protein [Cyanobacteriota bacterium]